MAHPRWPGYDTKTGNPVIDNQNRSMNRRMWRELKQTLKVQASGRKRKKMIKRVEGGRYLIILNELAMSIYGRDHS